MAEKWSQVDQPLPIELPILPRECVCSDPNYYFRDMTMNVKNGDLICTYCQGKIT